MSCMHYKPDLFNVRLNTTNNYVDYWLFSPKVWSIAVKVMTSLVVVTRSVSRQFIFGDRGLMRDDRSSEVWQRSENREISQAERRGAPIRCNYFFWLTCWSTLFQAQPLNARLFTYLCEWTVWHGTTRAVWKHRFWFVASRVLEAKCLETHMYSLVCQFNIAIWL